MANMCRVIPSSCSTSHSLPEDLKKGLPRHVVYKNKNVHVVCFLLKYSATVIALLIYRAALLLGEFRKHVPVATKYVRKKHLKNPTVEILAT